MNQAKINAIIRQVFAILGSVIVFIPSLAGIAEFLPQAESILNEIVGIVFVILAFVGQIKTNLDAKNTEVQIQTLGYEPSWTKGIVNYFTLT